MVSFAQKEKLLHAIDASSFDSNKKARYYIITEDEALLEDEFKTYTKVRGGVYLVNTSWKHVKEIYTTNQQVAFIQPVDRQASIESIIRQHDLTVNGITLIHHEYPKLTGATITVSVKENLFDTADVDIATRAFTDDRSSEILQQHATQMATLIAGAGNSYLSGRGVAKEATVLSADFAHLSAESKEYYLDKGVSIQNHSYGVGIENYYGVEAVDYDQSVMDNPTLFHSFSIGNRGSEQGTGTYANVESFGTITGTFKQAKNVILSTSSDTLGGISYLNSRGPAYDGRIKPDLVAFGGEGSSESAALVSGAAALLQERYMEINGQLPASHLVKGLLIAGAKEMLSEGPDFTSGYGQMNLPRSVGLLDSSWVIQSSVANGEIIEYEVLIPDQIKKLKVVLCWADPPATEGTPMALVNDLELLVSDSEGINHLPWVLDASPDKLQNPATRGKDHLNNVEVVSIDHPKPGSWHFSVEGFNVLSDQPFSIVYLLEEEDHFKWVYPTSSDPVNATSVWTARWDSNIEQKGMLQYRLIGQGWEDISNVSLADEKFLWPKMDTTALAQLRIMTQQHVYESDTFLMSVQPEMQVLLNCDDLSIISWQNMNASGYEISRYESGALVPITTSISDTTLQVEKLSAQSNLLTVAPIFDQYVGLPSFLTNIDQQGAGCFINYFFAYVEEKVVNLDISLSGLGLIDRLSITRNFNGTEEMILNQHRVVDSQIAFVDQDAGSGFNNYFLQVTTSTGETIIQEQVVLLSGSSYLLFPTLVEEGVIVLVSPEVGGQMNVYNSNGSHVKTVKIDQLVQEIRLANLPTGVYFSKINNGATETTFKLIIKD